MSAVHASACFSNAGCEWSKTPAHTVCHLLLLLLLLLQISAQQAGMWSCMFLC
jgi:hypothetical protein